MKVKNIFAGLALNSYWSLSFFLSNSVALRLFDMTKTIYKYNAFCTWRKRRHFQGINISIL